MSSTGELVKLRRKVFKRKITGRCMAEVLPPGMSVPGAHGVPEKERAWSWTPAICTGYGRTIKRGELGVIHSKPYCEQHIEELFEEALIQHG